MLPLYHLSYHPLTNNPHPIFSNWMRNDITLVWLCPRLSAKKNNFILLYNYSFQFTLKKLASLIKSSFHFKRESCYGLLINLSTCLLLSSHVYLLKLISHIDTLTNLFWYACLFNNYWCNWKSWYLSSAPIVEFIMVYVWRQLFKRIMKTDFTHAHKLMWSICFSGSQWPSGLICQIRSKREKRMPRVCIPAPSISFIPGFQLRLRGRKIVRKMPLCESQ